VLAYSIAPVHDDPAGGIVSKSRREESAVSPNLVHSAMTGRNKKCHDSVGGDILQQQLGGSSKEKLAEVASFATEGRTMG
jgi:hypothetical protein